MSISLQKIHVGTSYRLSLLALYVTQQVLYSKHIDLKTFPLFFFFFLYQWVQPIWPAAA